MGEVNIASALNCINASTAKSQTEGLNDLKHILSHNRRSAKVDDVKVDSWHTIYDTLFRFITSERSTYMKESRSTRKSASETRLSLGAEVLRLVVEVHVCKLRTKTLKSLLDHILQSLPTPRGNFCKPLSLNYTRCLRIILEFQPHVEHLSNSDWKAIANFCLEAIASLCGITAASGNHDGNESPASRTPDASARTSRSGTREPTNSERGAGGDSKGLLEELTGCVRQLTRAPNAPVLDSAQQLLATLIGFLKSTKSVGGPQTDAFAAINSVLARTSYESVKTTQGAIQELVPIIKDTWSTKLSTVRDEMLITLIHGKSHIEALFRQSGNELFRRHIENLLETIQVEYVRRQDSKDLLQLDDLRLESSCSRKPGQISLKTAAFSLRSDIAHAGSSRAESSFRPESHWMIVFFIAFFATLLDGERAKAEQQWVANERDPKRKRPRLSLFLDDYFRQLSDPYLSGKISALQFITFIVHLAPLDEDRMLNVLDKLIAHVGDEKGTVSAWAMLALAK